jgi:beta-glucanase (GH16 family)
MAPGTKSRRLSVIAAAALAGALASGCGAEGATPDGGPRDSGSLPDGAARPDGAAPPDSAAPPDGARPQMDGGTVIFFDDFTGSALSPDWTVVVRHGEYAQSETECNVADAVSVANGNVNIVTSAKSANCGDFNVDGSVRHMPQAWPYTTGDIQWKSLSFTYGTVTIRAKFPDQGTGTWPALWLLGTNCQRTNPETADVGYDTCPDLSSPDYAEIDMVECDLNNWCQLALSNVGNFPTCGFLQDPLDTSYHTFQLTWTPTEVSVSMDGADTMCSFASPQWVIPSTPMFLIMQTQTGGAGGAPNDGALPTTFSIDWVQVTQP